MLNKLKQFFKPEYTYRTRSEIRNCGHVIVKGKYIPIKQKITLRETLDKSNNVISSVIIENKY